MGLSKSETIKSVVSKIKTKLDGKLDTTGNAASAVATWCGTSMDGTVTATFIIYYCKLDPSADPMPEDLENFNEEILYADPALARTDYIAMMSNIEIPEDEETNSQTQSDLSQQLMS